jgi:hypothetical protein
MADATTPITERIRKKKVGVIGKVWNASGNVIINTASVAENATELISKTFQVGNEVINPILVDNRVETLNAIAQGVSDLTAMGVSEEEAKTYLIRGIM